MDKLLGIRLLGLEVADVEVEEAEEEDRMKKGWSASWTSMMNRVPSRVVQCMS